MECAEQILRYSRLVGKWRVACGGALTLPDRHFAVSCERRRNVSGRVPVAPYHRLELVVTAGGFERGYDAPSS
jgi:hypothetical protein